MRSVMLLSAALIVIASSVALATPTAPPMGPPQNGRGHNGSKRLRECASHHRQCRQPQR